MLNASKISGRTAKGLGIGFFNAITEKAPAKIKNNDTGEIRKIILEPFANYNVLSLYESGKSEIAYPFSFGASFHF